MEWTGNGEPAQDLIVNPLHEKPAGGKDNRRDRVDAAITGHPRWAGPTPRRAVGGFNPNETLVMCCGPNILVEEAHLISMRHGYDFKFEPFEL